MKVSVIGAAGGVGRRVAAQAAAAGHEVRALVRTEEQAEMLRLHGAVPVLGDLTGNPGSPSPESPSSGGWQAVLDGADAVVWAAGAGTSGNYEAIDGDALIAVVGALLQRGPRRLVVVSSMGVDRPDQMPPFLAAVLRVKARSDGHVQGSGLDWTIVRPGGLTDTPGTGRVQVAPQVPGGMIPRDDVAAVVLAALGDPTTIHKTFEVVSGKDSLTDALAGLPA